MDEVFTSAEVAKMERRTAQWVTEACKRGRFPGAYRSGPRAPWRIPAAAIARHRELNQEQTPPRFVAGIETRSARSKRRQQLNQK